MLSRCTDHGGLSGTIYAIEGVRGASVALNSPTGCKFTHAMILDSIEPKTSSLTPFLRKNRFYFNQNYIPTTYIDEHDYIYGPGDKLRSMLDSISVAENGLVAIINSPGASLIGEDIDKALRESSLVCRTLVFEKPPFKSTFAQGYQKACKRLVAELMEEKSKDPALSVNLLGISIMQLRWKETVRELARLLSLCGIRVNCALCAGCSIDEIKKFKDASLNVVIHQEYAMELAVWLCDTRDMEYLILENGAPFGFEATGAMVEAVCERLGTDPKKALEEIECAKERVCTALSKNSIITYPRGMGASIVADPSLAYPLARWTYEYLGIIPLAVDTGSEENSLHRKMLREFLDSIGCLQALGKDPLDTESDIVFADGATIACCKKHFGDVAGIEISQLMTDYVDIVPKPLLGIRGALWAVERIINLILSAERAETRKRNDHSRYYNKGK